MFEVLKLIELAPELSARDRENFRQRLQTATVALPDVQSMLLAPVSPGGYNAGDLIWRVAFLDESSSRRAFASGPWQAIEAALLGDRACVRRLEHVAFASGVRGGVSPRGGVYRVALFCANRAPSDQRLARFAAETQAMPRYIRSIRSWQLAVTCEAAGSRPWTHVWEQEYEDATGLLGSYMMHPYHWAHVDRWFDPEWPEWLVDPTLCHAFCEVTAPVIAPGSVTDAARRGA